jgi:enoyl-[acyl-carrier-protein] reductase (NADH)
MRRPITIEDVGNVAVCLVSDAVAALTGHTVYADAGITFWDSPFSMKRTSERDAIAQLER